MEGCVRVVLPANQLKYLVEKAKDYLVTHGLIYRTKSAPDDPDIVTHVPATLFPSPVPRQLFQQARDVQNDINLLMHKVAGDHAFMKQCLEQVIKVDDFTKRLWEIYDTVTAEGLSQPYSLGLTRSDYMFDCEKSPTELTKSGQKIDPGTIKLRQIEVNLMASSFGGLCQRMEGFHRFMLGRLKKTQELKNIPKNNAMQVLAQGMVKAWEMYNVSHSAVLFLVDESERNRYDQFHLETAVYDCNNDVQIIRRTMKDLRERAKLTDDKRLVIDDIEVSVVYQRALYSPDHYKCEEDWMTRLLLERSKAIKCPSAGYHLAGTKKIQQVLAQDGVMERFVSAQAAARIRDTFARQYSLDLDEEGDRAVAMAMADPHKFVLKPQREGGGNNTFGDDICRVLSELGRTEERTAYILMQLIHATPVNNYMMWTGMGTTATAHDCVSELGVFGAFVGTSDKVILNESGGHILRTKMVGTNEGGVASGFSCLDSPYLVD